jgi:hypothetical protein
MGCEKKSATFGIIISLTGAKKDDFYALEQLSINNVKGGAQHNSTAPLRNLYYPVAAADAIIQVKEFLSKHLK